LISAGSSRPLRGAAVDETMECFLQLDTSVSNGHASMD
jgi:hypothetical protein